MSEKKRKQANQDTNTRKSKRSKQITTGTQEEDKRSRKEIEEKSNETSSEEVVEREKESDKTTVRDEDKYSQLNMESRQHNGLSSRSKAKFCCSIWVKNIGDKNATRTDKNAKEEVNRNFLLFFFC